MKENLRTKEPLSTEMSLRTKESLSTEKSLRTKESLSTKESLNTKEHIMQAALDMFSIRGYSAVSIRDIGRVVGVKESTIYYHYTNKQAILDAITERMQDIHNKRERALGMTDEPEQALTLFQQISEEQLYAMGWGLLDFYRNEPFACQFRRMVMIEQFCNETLGQLYRQMFIEGPLAFQSQLFAGLMHSGVMKRGNTGQAALAFYAPIFLLLQHTTLDDQACSDTLRRHIQVFQDHYMEG